MPIAPVSAFQHNEILGLKRSQMEQTEMIDTLKTMISKLVNDNEMKGKRIQNLESEVTQVQKTLDEYKKASTFKFDNIDSMVNQHNSRQVFDQVMNDSSTEQDYQYSKHNSEIFARTQNLEQQQRSNGFSSVSGSNNKNDSRYSDENDVSIISKSNFNNKVVKEKDIEEVKEGHIDVYNPSIPSTRPDFH